MDGVGELQRLAELQQRNVIVKGHLVVIWMGYNPLQREALHTIILVLVLHAAVRLPIGRNVVPVVGCRAGWGQGYVHLFRGNMSEGSLCVCVCVWSVTRARP